MKYLLSILVVFMTCGGAGSLAAQFCARIPYRLVGEKMMVKATVNGVEGNFLFDTGAPVCVSYSFAQKLGLNGGTKVSFQDSNGQQSESDVVVLNRVLLGGVEFSRVECAVFEKGNMVEGFGVDGIIGYTLFGDKIVELNSRSKEITISNDPDYFSLNPAWASEMMAGAFVPYIQVRLGEHLLDTVMFDSGAGGFYDLSMKSFQRMKGKEALQLLSQGHGILSLGASGLEDKTVKYRVVIPDFSFGSGKFKCVTSVTTLGDSRLGSGVLRYGIVTLDYPKRQFYFQPFSEVAPELYRKEWNVVITVMDGYLTAGFIWESMQNQLEGGERIVEVNGKRFDKVDTYQAMTTNLIDLSAGKAEIVVIDKKSGKEKKVEIKME